MRALLRLLGVPAGLLLVVVVGAPACGPSSFPDQTAVSAAQDSWCLALAKASGAGDKWDRLGECKGATVSASASYLRGMAKCFPVRKAAGGDKDNGILVAECRDETLFNIKIDEANAQEAINARCDRAARCEKAAVADCVAAAKHADTNQRATLYGIYNGAAIHKLSDCLSSSSCREDEYAAQQACYKTVDDKLLWTP